jgi:two-component system OmpR family response regulator
MRILLVEDDIMIGEAVSTALKDGAYSIDWVTDGESGWIALQNTPYDGVLLDLGLPKQDGLSLLQQCRNQGNATPIIIITARDGIENRIKGLDLGADDYLVKPFDVSELLARLRAVIRRQGGQSSPIFSVGDLELNTSTHQARFLEQEASLTAREFSLLHTLMLTPGKIFSRGELEDRVYGWNEEVESNAIDFLIHGIRKKLGSKSIKNLRGAGWMVNNG